MPPEQIPTRRLGAGDLAAIRGMNRLFAEAFEDPESYERKKPDDAYLEGLLEKDGFLALVAEMDGKVVGAAAAYELWKFEQQRSEIYLYDLAVDDRYRRLGIATALIGLLQQIAAEKGAWVIFVQADHGDDPAIALYTKLGVREDVLHFDIQPSRKGR